MNVISNAVGICSKCGSIMLFRGDFEYDQDGNSEVYACEYCEEEVQLKRDDEYEESCS